jgi:hypothetical protein
VRRAAATPATLARAGTALLVAAALLANPSSAAATAPVDHAPLRVDCRGQAGRLLAAIDLGAAIDTELERRLGSGLASTVRLVVAALDPSGTAAAVVERDFDVRYDVWTEVFTVTTRGAGVAASSRQASDWASVRRLLANPAPFDLGPLAALPARFAIEARIELDPVTRLQLEKIREQLTHPAGGPSAGGRSLLGTLAAVLLRAPPPNAERFRSATLTRADLPMSAPPLGRGTE